MKEFFRLTFLFVVASLATGESLYATMVSDTVQVPDRAALQALLGGAGTLEDFESYDAPAETATPVNTWSPATFGSATAISSTTVVNGQGPGLVSPKFSFKASFLTWYGQGFEGASSQEVGSQATYFYVDFVETVDAFGLDIRSYQTWVPEAQVVVYAADDTTVIGSATYPYGSNSRIPIFVGWHSAEGIGSIRLSQYHVPFSPSLDNLEFGIAVPEPSVLVLCFTAMVLLSTCRTSNGAYVLNR